MSSNTNLVVGPYEVEATGLVTFVSHGEGLFIRSAGIESDLTLGSAGSINLLGTEIGTIQHALAPPDVGPRIQLEPGMVTIAVGPPGAGSSITLTETGIILQVDEATYTLTAEGIVEEVAEVSRELTEEGHNFTAAETEYNIGVEGITVEAPLKEETYEGNLTLDAGLAEIAVEGARTDEAGITMVE